MLEWIRKYWAQITAVVAIVMALTTTNIKVERHEIEIESMKERQTSSEQVLNDIKTELAQINVKLGYIIEGKIVLPQQGNK